VTAYILLAINKAAYNELINVPWR